MLEQAYEKGGWKQTSKNYWEQVVRKPFVAPYGNPYKRIWIAVQLDRFGRDVVLVQGVSGYIRTYNVDTRSDGLKFAKDWMKKYPKGT